MKDFFEAEGHRPNNSVCFFNTCDKLYLYRTIVFLIAAPNLKIDPLVADTN